MNPVVRFAPSPTGLLHVGNTRTVLINWLFAYKHQGTFILRLDDTDFERSRDEYTDAIHQDLNWLGLSHDRYEVQSKRLQKYEKAAESLKEQGLLYPCYETPEELDFKRRLQRTQGLPPIYDRAALKLTASDIQKYQDQGRKPHWRFVLKDEPVSWDDLVRGMTRFDRNTASDPILIREDGTFVYTLCSVVDDIDMGVTHIIRGEDHVSNTAVQVQLFKALGAGDNQFTFGHLPLMVGEQGESLSKRLGSLSLNELRDQDIESLALNSYLAKIGTSEDVTPAFSMEQLISEFDITYFGRASPRFSLPNLEKLNAKFLHGCDFKDIQPKLKTHGLEDVDHAFWQAVQGNLTKVKDLNHFIEICQKEITPKIEDPAYIHQAMDVLPEMPWDLQTWSQWTELLKAKTDRKGKALYMPLRLALTGESHGPEMKDYLPLLGRDRVLKRLQGLKA